MAGDCLDLFLALSCARKLDGFYTCFPIVSLRYLQSNKLVYDRTEYACNGNTGNIPCYATVLLWEH